MIEKKGNDADIIRWHDEEGKSFREIGRLIGISHVSIQKRYRRAKEAAQEPGSQSVATAAPAGIDTVRLAMEIPAPAREAQQKPGGVVTAPERFRKVEDDTQPHDRYPGGNHREPKPAAVQPQYLKKLGTPDWDYHVATPQLLAEMQHLKKHKKDGQLLPYDPKTRCYMVESMAMLQYGDTLKASLMPGESLAVIDGIPQ